MHTEIEAKFLHIDPDQLRQRLQACGAVLVQRERVMRRASFDSLDGRLYNLRAWVRVRDEGDKITMSYKQLNDRTLHGTKEINLVVDNYDTAISFLQATGLHLKSQQETRRESWRLGNTEIEIDWWPWIDPLVELEGPSESDLRTVAHTLELDWSKALHGSVEVAYQDEYDVTEHEINYWEEIIFTPVPDWLKPKRRKDPHK